MYKQLLHGLTKEILSVVRIEDNTYIPFDPANTDYQAYLKWVAKGNTPMPPDELVQNP